MRIWRKALAMALLGAALAFCFAAESARAVEVVYQYDSAGRLTTVIQDGEAISYSFDAAGHLTDVAVPEPSGGLAPALVLLALASQRRLRSASVSLVKP